MQLSNVVQDLWQIQRIKRLIRTQSMSGPQCLISVRETACKDPSCEGPATEIKIVRFDLREVRTTIHKAPCDVTDEDITKFVEKIWL